MRKKHLRRLGKVSFKIPSWASSTALLFYILLFCWLGLYAQPQADDHFFRLVLQEKGFYSAQVYLYTSVHGRLTASFFILSALQISYALLPWITVTLSLCCLYLLLSEANKSLTPKTKVEMALLLQAAWFASVPGLNENFYWLTGSAQYTWAAIFSVLCIAGVIHVMRAKKRGAFFYLLCLLVFFNGMISELTSVMQIIVLFFLTLYFISRKDNHSTLTVGIPFFAALGGFFVIYLSPATAGRMASARMTDFIEVSFIAARLFRTFIVAAGFGCVTILRFFMKPIVYVFLLFLPSIAENVAPFDQKNTSRLRSWHIIALVAMIAPFMNAIAGWAEGGGFSPRGDGLVIWIMGVAWMFLWTFGYRNEAVLGRIRSLRLYRWREILLVLCLLLSGNFITLLRDLPLGPSFAAEYKEREAYIALQENEGKTLIFVPTLTAQPKLLLLEELGPFPGHSGVGALPEPFLDYEQAILDLREGKPSRLEALAEVGDPEIQYHLGQLYNTRTPFYGIPKDNTEAVKWYRMAAAQGHTVSCRRLARFYALGLDVPRNYLYALGWLVRSQF